MKRVVITGMGAVTPLGNTVKEFWHNLVDGKLGIGKITKFDSEDTGVALAGEVKEFDPSAVLERKEQKNGLIFSIWLGRCFRSVGNEWFNRSND